MTERRFSRRNWEGGDGDEYQEPREQFDISIEYEPEIPATPLLRVDRNPLVIWAEHTGIPVDFWENLGVKAESDRYISFNWPEGWKKIRNVLLRVDAVTNKDKVVRRFHWVSPPPGAVHPLWPSPADGEHPEIWLCEGESDCAVLRYLGFDAYTFGAATCYPTDIELRMLEFMGVKRVVLVYDADPPGRKATEKVAEAIAAYADNEQKNPIDVLTIDLGVYLSKWKYLKDIRDLFNKTTHEEMKALLGGARDALLLDREEDISAATVIENATMPSWCWDGLMAQVALNLLYGPPKVGKTTLTYHMIKAMGGADGTGDKEQDNHVYLLTRHVEPQRVLYYSEMPSAFDRQAMEIVCGGPLQNLWLRNAGDKVFNGMAWPQIVMQIERDVAKYDIDYVIIDTVIEWFKFNSEEMYDAAVVGKKLSLLRRLTSKGVTVQINHHPPKGGGTPFGSVAFQGYVDSLVEMERDDKGTTLSAIGRLRSDFSSIKYGFADKEGKELSLLKMEDRGDRDTDSGTAMIAGIKGRLVALLPYAPGAMTLTELLEDELLKAAGHKSVRTRLAELVRAKMVATDEARTPKYWRTYGFEIVKEKGDDAV